MTKSNVTILCEINAYEKIKTAIIECCKNSTIPKEWIPKVFHGYVGDTNLFTFQWTDVVWEPGLAWAKMFPLAHVVDDVLCFLDDYVDFGYDTEGNFGYNFYAISEENNVFKCDNTNGEELCGYGLRIDVKLPETNLPVKFL